MKNNLGNIWSSLDKLLCYLSKYFNLVVNLHHGICHNDTHHDGSLYFYTHLNYTQINNIQHNDS